MMLARDAGGTERASPTRGGGRSQRDVGSAHPKAGRDGYILVAVLGVMLVLTGFMAAGSLVVRSALDSVRAAQADAPTIGLTRAGLELTAYQLFVLQAPPAAVDGRRIHIAGGSFVPHLVDEGGKADLNQSDTKLLTSVFKGAGLDEASARSLMTCVTELRGPDRTSDASPAAQGASPQSGALPDIAAAAQQINAQQTTSATQGTASPRLRGFQSVDQLRDCPDLTREDFSALAPLLTVYNPDGKIDILTASPDLLHALPGLSDADVEVILARRGNPDPKTADDLIGLMKEAATYGKTARGPAFTVRIEAVSATGRKKTIHAVIASSKSRDAPFYVLDRWD